MTDQLPSIQISDMRFQIALRLIPKHAAGFQRNREVGDEEEERKKNRGKT